MKEEDWDINEPTNSLQEKTTMFPQSVSQLKEGMSSNSLRTQNITTTSFRYIDSLTNHIDQFAYDFLKSKLKEKLKMKVKTALDQSCLYSVSDLVN